MQIVRKLNKNIERRIFMDVKEAIPKSIATIMKDTYVYVKTDILEKPDIHFLGKKYEKMEMKKK